MICKKCGKENPDNSQMCYFCGDNLYLQRGVNNNQSTSNMQVQDNNLNIFGVPLSQNMNNSQNQSIQQKNIIKFDNQSSSQNTQPLNNQLGSEIIFDIPISNSSSNLNGQNNNSALIQSTDISNNTIDAQDSNDLYNLKLENVSDNSSMNSNTKTAYSSQNDSDVENNTNLSSDKKESLNESINNIAISTTTPQNNVSQVQLQKKPKKGNGLFILGIVLIIVAGILIALPFLMKEPNRLKSIENNSNLKLSENGEINGTIKINSSSEEEYIVTSNYYKNNDVYNVKFELSKDDDIKNIYMSLSSKNLNIYIPSDFIDLFGSTKSDETQWINYSINFINEIDILNYKLAELFDSEHFKYVNDVNDTKHYRLLLDNQIFESNNINEYFYNRNLEIYANKDDFLSRFTITIDNIGESKSYLDIDIRFKEGSTSNVTIPSDVLSSALSLDSYIENNKILSIENN